MVVAHQVPADSVLVRVNASGAMTSCSRASVCGSRQAYEARPAGVRPGARRGAEVSAAASPHQLGGMIRLRGTRLRPALPAAACVLALVSFAATSCTTAPGPGRSPSSQQPSVAPSPAAATPAASASPLPPLKSKGRPLQPVPDVRPPGFCRASAGAAWREPRTGPVSRAAAGLAAVRGVAVRDDARPPGVRPAGRHGDHARARQAAGRATRPRPPARW